MRVVWYDAKMFGNAWFDENEVSELHCPLTVTEGLWAGEDEITLRIAQNRSGGYMSNITTIPKSCIMERENGGGIR